MNNFTRFFKKYALSASAVATLIALPCSVYAEEAVDRTIETSDSPRVDIEHINGKAEIRGWDKSEVRVSGTLGDNTEEFVFEKQGNVILIHVEVERSDRRWGNYQTDGDDLLIYVPFNSYIDYDSINADVRIEDVKKGVSVEVVNGDVDIENVDAAVEADAVNGDITLENVTGRLAVETVNGSISGTHSGDKQTSLESVNGGISVSTTSPRVQVETVNGRIELKLAEIDMLEVNTVNGRLSAQMTLNKNGEVYASSVGGGINLTFQPDVSARFDIQAHAGGSISNDITSDKMQKAKYGPRRWLEFVHGSGDANVDVSTVNGRVSLDIE